MQLCSCKQTIPVYCWGQMLFVGMHMFTLYVDCTAKKLISPFFGTLAITLHFQWDRTIPKIAPSPGWPHIICDSLGVGPTRVCNPNGISIESAVSLQLTVFSLYTLHVTRPNNASFPGNGALTWFLGPTRVHNPNRISIGSSVFAGFMLCPTDTHRQTDHATSIAIGRILLFA